MSMNRSVPPRKRPLKIGLILPHWTALPCDAPYWWATELGAEVPRWSDLLAMAQQAEAAGFDSLWLVDHLLIRCAAVNEQYGRPVPPELAAASVGVWECWSLLAALAATTTRIELGTLVSCTNYRNPALTAKMADTVDEISGGRLILGLGAGDYEDEHRSFGMRWDHRVSRFAEALAIIHPLLREGRVDFTGIYEQSRDCELRPRGPRPSGPPIMIGTLAHGPRMLELTARYADMWNGWIANRRTHPEVVPPLRAAVDTACLSVGRDPATLNRALTIGVAFGGRGTWGGEPLSGSPEEIAQAFRAFADEGISHLHVWLNPTTAEGIEQLAPVLDQLDQSV
jgi:alkanesulfonate monooxygenase SsuD/methylene tetrahydromethanopterin reductase-like flavin-dependent oxidoreductase (luciferase family)